MLILLLLSPTRCCVIDYDAKFGINKQGLREQKNPLSYSPLGNTEVDFWINGYVAYPYMVLIVPVVCLRYSFMIPLRFSSSE